MEFLIAACLLKLTSPAAAAFTAEAVWTVERSEGLMKKKLGDTTGTLPGPTRITGEFPPPPPPPAPAPPLPTGAAPTVVAGDDVARSCGTPLLSKMGMKPGLDVAGGASCGSRMPPVGPMFAAAAAAARSCCCASASEENQNK